MSDATHSNDRRRRSLRPDQMRQSRVGKRPVELPKGVTVTVANGKIDVKGPKGTLSRPLTPNVKVKVEGTEVHVDPDRRRSRRRAFPGARPLDHQRDDHRRRHGLREDAPARRHRLPRRGEGQDLNLALGFSHPVNFPIPEGIKVEIPGDSKGTLIILTGADKELMGQTAAKIRGFRPPEPYGGKGVRYQGEKVREKAGKAAKGGK